MRKEWSFLDLRLIEVVDIRLGGPDLVSIEFLQNWPGGMFISPLVDNSDPRIHQFLIERYFTDGAALFGRESVDEMNDFRRVCGGSLDDETDADVYGIVQYFVQRTRNYAHLGTLLMAEIDYLRVDWGGDECAGKDGLVISTFEFQHRIAWSRMLSHEDYGKKFYGRNLGFPPFYLLCTCRIEGVIDGVDE